MKDELAEYCPGKTVKVVATGGLSGMIDAGIDSIDYFVRCKTFQKIICLGDAFKRLRIPLQTTFSVQDVVD